MTQRNKNYLEDMLDMSDVADTNEFQSEIPEFFAGSNVLITGGSGFLGILLIEKLLRCCPNIGKLYIFMRAKKDKTPEQRFKEHFDCPIYDKLKKEQPNFNTKVMMVEADLSKLDLGLSQESRKYLLDTNVIFHAAATVRFNETMRIAVNINVRGTKQLLLFAKELPNLKSFVHISSAFAYCVHNCIEEKYYPPPIETDKILTLLDILDDEKLDKFTPTLIGEWPNSYTYTKAIAEDTVRQYSIGIPVCIVRPSIVTSTAEEPLNGWINNIYGAVGVVMGSAIGILRTLHCDPDKVAEIVPADYVISHFIAASWDTAKRRNTLLSIENANPDVPETERVPIYNYVSACQNPITWRRFMKINEIYGMQVPSTHVFWYYFFFLNKHKLVHNFCVIFLHIIPAIVTDILLVLTGRKPMLLNAYKKIHKFSSVISYFSSKEWRFSNDAVVKLWSRVSLADRQIFNFDIDNLNWESYLKHMIPGLRLYIAKDPLETIDKGREKYEKLKIFHYTLLTVITALLVLGVINLIIRVMSFS
ncbi:PREDICTED: fatty acyl-CoA reductase 1-like [Wasmannia auropunctata]|uniref:fatty acyl-CoA reductase 1-like n=1 Tax=Wasmannia auropunctata TaxID=64793 RepID=UPI0005EF2E91|nr:PREDICTED: fatty acyl-CoA reductase 1-like [Wasmannia auropunctata]XP_011688429.1 PREDICTED: fatty acyl-CoA reductase 1-like [Wasmannia auropunctata]